MMLSNTPEGSHKHAYAAHTETERTFTDTNIPHLHQCLLPRSSDHNKVHLLSFGWRTIRWFFCTKSISVLAVTLRVLHSCPPLSLFVSCNSVMVPCGLLGTSGAEELMHKDAFSLKRHKQVFSVVTPLH